MRVSRRSLVLYVAVVFAGLCAVAEAAAQGTDPNVIGGWERRLNGLEAQVKALRADDRQGTADAAARVQELEATSISTGS